MRPCRGAQGMRRFAARRVEPPFSLRWRRKENGRSRSKEKTPIRNPAQSLGPAPGCFHTGVAVAGAVQTCGLTPGALWSWETKMVLRRIWGSGCGFRGWLTKGLSFLLRTFHFAMHYREVNGAAAEIEGSPCVHRPESKWAVSSCGGVLPPFADVGRTRQKTFPSRKHRLDHPSLWPKLDPKAGQV